MAPPLLIWLRQVTHIGLNLIFPPLCSGCGRLGENFCDVCAQAVEPEKPSGAGWARPLGARMWHYFWGGEGLSLCWRGYWTGERTAREQNSPDNCELCARKLEKQP